MSKTTVNVPLLRKVLEHVTAHPEEWDQNTWAADRTEECITVQIGRFRCGTTMCIAGTAAHLSGYRFDWSETDPSAALKRAGCVTDGRTIAAVGQEVLGLSRAQADRLFNTMTRDPAVVWRIASKFTGGEIKVPADLPERSS